MAAVDVEGEVIPPNAKPPETAYSSSAGANVPGTPPFMIFGIDPAVKQPLVAC